MKVLLGLVTSVLGFLPSLALAEGLVPCGNEGQPSCQACYLYVLVENIFEWIFGIMLVIAAILIVVGGLRLIFSGGSVTATQKARSLIKTALVGLILAGLAWTIIDLLIATLYGQADAASVWTSLQCVDSGG